MSNAENQEKVAWYDKPWVMYVCLVFFPPAGLVLLFLNREKYKSWKKIGAVGLVWMILGFGFSQSGKEEREAAREQARIEQQQKDEQAKAEREEQKAKEAEAERKAQINDHSIDMQEMLQDIYRDAYTRKGMGYPTVQLKGVDSKPYKNDSNLIETSGPFVLSNEKGITHEVYALYIKDTTKVVHIEIDGKVWYDRDRDGDIFEKQNK